MKFLAIRHLLVVSSLVSLTGKSTAPLVADTVIIAATGDIAPDGNGTLEGVFGSAPNASGQLAFLANLTDTSGGGNDDGGIFFGSGGPLTQVARKGQTAPDENGRFTDFGLPGLNASGQVAFQAFLARTGGGSNDDEGIFLGSGGSITQVARKGQAAPDANGTFFGFYGGTGSSLGFDDFFVPNASGQVAFRGDLTGTSGGSSDSQGIFLGSGGPITQVARTGQAAPDANGSFSSFTGASELNASGQAAFHAILTGTSGGSNDDNGIFLGAGGQITQVARKGQAVPDANGTFYEFGDYSVNASGEVTFEAFVLGDFPYWGMFLGSGGPITQVSDARSATGYHSWNASRQVAFEADQNGTGAGGDAYDRGIFLGNGIDAIPVARTGEWMVTREGTNDNAFIDELHLGGLNDLGQIGYTAQSYLDPPVRAVVARYTLDPDIHWAVPPWGSFGGDWGSASYWTNDTVPNSFHNAFIDPPAGLTVRGPAAPLFLNSLTIGTQTSGVAELVLIDDLATFNGVTIQDRGRLTLSGQKVSSDVTLVGTGRVIGYGLILGTLDGNTGQAGVESSGRNYHHAGPLDLGSRDATVASVGFANLGTQTTFDGGTIYVPNGLFIQGASSLDGNGTISGKIAAGFGSTISANGSLTLGDSDSYSGFTSDGELYTAAHEVVINDRNEAVLGSLTHVGDGVNGGTLTAGNANPSDTHAHFLVERGKNVVGRGTVNGHFKNHGHVVGDGTAMNERLTFGSDWTVTGKGTFTNTLVLGTFDPGESPAIVGGENQAFAGTVNIELGGITPGFGAGDHDQINDAATIWLFDEPELAILPWNAFVPTPGDKFEIMTWQTGLAATFGTVTIDPWFDDNGIDFVLNYNDPTAAGNLTLTVTTDRDPHPGDANLDGTTDLSDFNIWNAHKFTSGAGWGTGDFSGDGTTDLSDFNIWNAHKFTVATGGAAPAPTEVPEPGTLFLFGCALAAMFVGWLRRSIATRRPGWRS